MLGYGETAKGERIPAYFVVSKLTTGKSELIEFGSLYSINAKKIAEDSTRGSPGFQSRTSATISIAKLLDLVNSSYSDILPQTVVEHYGIQRRNTKLGRSVKYSLSSENKAPKKYGDYAVYGEDVMLEGKAKPKSKAEITAPKTDLYLLFPLFFAESCKHEIFANQKRSFHEHTVSG